jgi:uracil-DNA glycosylase family 4
MAPYGKNRKKIMIISDMPSAEDDFQGRPFMGKSGKYLRKLFKSQGILLDRDTIQLNAISCRTHKGKSPSPINIAACRSRVWDAIKEYKPKLIICMGGAVLESIMHHRWKKSLDGITKWRGNVIPDRDTKCWLTFTYKPSYVLREKKKQPVLQVIFKNDIINALAYLDKPFPQYDEEEKFIRVLTDEQEQLAWFKYAFEKQREPGLLAFDYETTGLKPHNTKVHKIACVSLCFEYGEAIVLPFPLSKKVMRWYKRILTHHNFLKTAHNMKFEDTWTRVLLNFRPHPWAWDSLQSAHIIDNRPYITGLKFQAYIKFGILGYDEGISKYLKAVEEKNANAINRVFEAPRALLLLYCGIDSLVQYRLALLQRKEMGYEKNESI